MYHLVNETYDDSWPVLSGAANLVACVSCWAAESVMLAPWLPLVIQTDDAALELAVPRGRTKWTVGNFQRHLQLHCHSPWPA